MHVDHLLSRRSILGVATRLGFARIGQAGAQADQVVPVAGGNSARTGKQPGPVPTDPVVHWSVQTSEGWRVSQPVVAQGIVLATTEGTLLALETATGAEIWRREGVGDCSAAIVGNAAIVAGPDFWGEGVFFALDLRTGSELWTFGAKDSPVNMAPVVRRSTAYVVSWETGVVDPDTFLFAVDVETGEQVWRFEVKGLVHANPAMSGDTLAIGTENGVYGVRLKDGEKLWDYRSNGAEHVAITSGLVICVGPRGLFALEAGSGRPAWISDTHGGSRHYRQRFPAAVSNGVAFEAGPDEVLRAQSPADGSVLWTFGDAWGPPSIVAGTVIVPNRDGVTGLDAASGDTLWKVPITVNGEPVRLGTSQPAIVGGMIYVALQSHIGTHVVGIGG